MTPSARKFELVYDGLGTEWLVNWSDIGVRSATIWRGVCYRPMREQWLDIPPRTKFKELDAEQDPGPQIGAIEEIVWADGTVEKCLHLGGPQVDASDLADLAAVELRLERLPADSAVFGRLMDLFSDRVRRAISSSAAKVRENASFMASLAAECAEKAALQARHRREVTLSTAEIIKRLRNPNEAAAAAKESIRAEETAVPLPTPVVDSTAPALSVPWELKLLELPIEVDGMLNGLRKREFHLRRSNPSSPSGNFFYIANTSALVCFQTVANNRLRGVSIGTWEYVGPLPDRTVELVAAICELAMGLSSEDAVANVDRMLAIATCDDADDPTLMFGCASETAIARARGDGRKFHLQIMPNLERLF